MRLPTPPATPQTEHESRLAAVRAAMEEEELDLLVGYADCWRTANVRYFTDFRPVDGVHGIAQAVIMIPAHGEPSLFVGDGCVDYAASETWFPVHALDSLGIALSTWARSGEPTAIGIAGLNQMPVALHQQIQEGTANLPLRATQALARVKARKSPWELDQLRHAAQLTDLAMETVRDLAQGPATLTERDLAQAADIAMIQAGADAPAYLSMVQSGPRSAFSLALPTGRTLKPGDLVLTDIGARYGNYVADGGRGFAYRKPSQRAIEIIETAADAVEAGLKSARPGITASELNSVIQGVLVERGYAQFSGEAMGRGTGHGTGMDPEEELPWIGPKDDGVLATGSVFTLKGTINGPDVGGLRTERIVHLSPEGLETLDAFPMRNYW